MCHQRYQALRQLFFVTIELFAEYVWHQGADENPVCIVIKKIRGSDSQIYRFFKQVCNQLSHSYVIIFNPDEVKIRIDVKLSSPFVRRPPFAGSRRRQLTKLYQFWRCYVDIIFPCSIYCFLFQSPRYGIQCNNLRDCVNISALTAINTNVTRLTF